MALELQFVVYNFWICAHFLKKRGQSAYAGNMPVFSHGKAPARLV